MEEMAPPAKHGSEEGALHEQSWNDDAAKQPNTNAPSRRKASYDNYSWTPSTLTASTGSMTSTASRQHPTGYRDDYSRAQHASLGEQPPVHQPGQSMYRSNSDVGAATPDHQRFSAYVNRFASHDPRMSPVSVKDRIKRFNSNTPPPSPQSMMHYPKTPPRRDATSRQPLPSQLASAPRGTGNVPEQRRRTRSVPPPTKQSEFQQTVSRPSRVDSSSINQEHRQREKEPNQNPCRSFNRAEPPPQPSVSHHRKFSVQTSSSRKEKTQRRSQSPIPVLASPNDTQDAPIVTTQTSSGSRVEQKRASRSLLSNYRHPREDATQKSNKEDGVHGSALQRARGDSIERRGRSMVGHAERRAQHQSTEGIARDRSKSPSSSRLLEQPSRPPDTQTATRRLSVSEDFVSICDTEDTPTSIQNLKKKLWDNKETLQVAVKPSLPAFGYAEKRTKQSTNYYGPEMAGHEGQRVRSLSPSRPRAAQAKARPASSAGVNSTACGALFKSRFYQAAIAAQRDGDVTPQTKKKSHEVSSAPQPKTNFPTTAHRSHQQEQRSRRLESPRPPPPPPPAQVRSDVMRGSATDGSETGPAIERTRSSPVTGSLSSRTSPSIERTPSSSGVSCSSKEPSVAKLVAKLNSINRDDPEHALKAIDTILRAESESPSFGGHLSRREVLSRSSTHQQEDLDTTQEDDDDSDDDSSDSSYDDTSVSSITNPTYQREDQPPAQSTANFRRPRPSSLNTYTQQQKVAPSNETRGKSSKAKKEKKPPPPSTIKVKENGADDDVDSAPAKKERKLDKFMEKSPEVDVSDAAAIALKIRTWDEMTIPSNPSFPSSPPRTVDEDQRTAATERTGATEDLGSIITPQSSPRLETQHSHEWDEHRPQTDRSTIPTEKQRTHPWDDHRPRDHLLRPVVLPSGGAEVEDFDDVGDDMVREAFESSSAWRRRRASKTKLNTVGTDGRPRSSPRQSAPESSTQLVHTSTANGSLGVRDTSIAKGIGVETVKNIDSLAMMIASGGTKEATDLSPRRSNHLPPNASDVSMKRRSKSRERRPEPAHEARDKDARSGPMSETSSRPEPHRTSRDKDARSGPKSEASNVFDSAWGALPANAFDTTCDDAFGNSRGSKSQPPSPLHVASKRRSKSQPPGARKDTSSDDVFDTTRASRSQPPSELPLVPIMRLPEGVTAAFSDNTIKLLETTTTPPLNKIDDLQPEARTDPKQGGSRLRRGFQKLRRSTTPKKNRSPSLPFSASPKERSKPLLSANAIDSVDHDADMMDKKKMKWRTAKTPARDRSNSLAGEEGTASLNESFTGSLNGSLMSVRNKNLAKKFSRFLRVYDDE